MQFIHYDMFRPLFFWPSSVNSSNYLIYFNLIKSKVAMEDFKADTKLKNLCIAKNAYHSNTRTKIDTIYSI
jgi:hypothetical protein